MRKSLLSIVLAALLVAGASTTALADKDKAGGKDKGRGGRDRPATYTIPGDKVFPEGIARVPHSKTFFVGSTTDGTIFRGDLRAPALTPFAAPGADGRTTAVGSAGTPAELPFSVAAIDAPEQHGGRGHHRR